jgi:hypothetical protein
MFPDATFDTVGAKFAYCDEFGRGSADFALVLSELRRFIFVLQGHKYREIKFYHTWYTSTFGEAGFQRCLFASALPALPWSAHIPITGGQS